MFVRIVALLIAVALVAITLSLRADARRKQQHAEAARATARRELATARERQHRTDSDLGAARAAVKEFSNAAQIAVGASGGLVNAEAALVDRLGRLQGAGANDQIDAYNRIVDELHTHGEDIPNAAKGLDVPFETFSRALGQLPTARCAGPLTEPVTWVAYGSSGLKCGRVGVPLDYAKPTGRHIELTVVRRPADDPQAQIGPLLINPGGPGISAIANLRSASLDLPAEMLRRFELVAFDPRGVGQSTPVDCADNLDPLFANALTDTKAAVRRAAVTRVRTLVHHCLTRSGDLLRHLDTRTTARDMDRVRAALQQQTINYLGFSYGTYLGAFYADLFPGRLRAAVLDGGVDPNRALGDLSLNHVPDNLDETLTEELDLCSLNPACGFNSSGKAGQAYDQLMDSLRAHPLGVGPRTLGRGLAELGVVASLYDGLDGQPRLMDALARAAVGDGQPLLALSDSYTGRRSDGSYNNELEAHAAINCIETSGRPTADAAEQHVRDLGPLDRFAAVDLMLTLPCAFWPVPTITNPPHGIHVKSETPILVLGNEHDPVTPIEGSRALAKALGSGHLLTWAGSGHTVLTRGIDCIDNAVVAYLVDLTVPPADTVCPA